MDILGKSPNNEKRAKEAGVNVSSIFSQLERALAAQVNEGNTVNDFERTYKKLRQ